MTLSGCSTCPLKIQTNSLGTTSFYDKYNEWRVSDNVLSWDGALVGQGMYWDPQTSTDVAASGTPAAWSTNDPSKDGYQPDNVYVAKLNLRFPRFCMSFFTYLVRITAIKH
jgi:hypothetical protein